MLQKYIYFIEMEKKEGVNIEKVTKYQSIPYNK